MSTPVGHAIAGMAVARRLGVTSLPGLIAAAASAAMPDADIIPGVVLHGDPWKLHRKTTHRPGFALIAGMVAGFSGIVTAGRIEGERDLIADALTGAAVIGSHVALDRIKLPYVNTPRSAPYSRHIRNELVNCAIDAAVFGTLAYVTWPRDRRTAR